jgi:hypothetical protein
MRSSACRDPICSASPLLLAARFHAIRSTKRDLAQMSWIAVSVVQHAAADNELEPSGSSKTDFVALT